MVSQNPAVFLFTGSDDYSKDKAVEKLKADISKGSPNDLDYRVFRGGESDPGDILTHIRTKPLFSEKKLVFIRGLDTMAADGIKLLAGAIKDLPGSTYLVLEAKDDSVLSSHPDLSGHLSVRSFGELKGQGLLSWAADFVSSASGKTIDKDAVFLLAELKGHLPVDLAGELEKLIAFTDRRRSIRVSDVEEVVGRSVMASAFDLGREIGKRDASAALEIVSDLVRSGKKPQDVIGAVSWHLNRMLRAFELRKKGRTDNEIIMELGIRRRESEEFFGQLKAFSMDGVRSGIKTLLSADLDIKRSRYDQRLILEFAVIRLCLA